MDYSTEIEVSKHELAHEIAILIFTLPCPPLSPPFGDIDVVSIHPFPRSSYTFPLEGYSYNNYYHASSYSHNHSIICSEYLP
jgi:hypothetical protein